MLTTPIYGFKKPELADSPPDITVTNPNWDTAEKELDELSLAIGQIAEKTTYIDSNNFLNNPDFQVWQRGDGSKIVLGVGTHQYTADRWIFASINQVKCAYAGSLYDGPIRFYTDAVVAPANTRFEQYLPLAKNMRRQWYTLSARVRCTGVASKRIGMALKNKYNGEVYAKGEFTITPNDWQLIHLTVYVEQCDMLVVSFGICTNSNDYNGLLSPQGMSIGESIDILHTKLEYGKIPSLFVSRIYSEELAMCQQYYESGRFVLVKGSGEENINYGSNIFYKVSKRVIPTFTSAISESLQNSPAFINGNPVATWHPNIHSLGVYVTSSSVRTTSQCVVDWTADAEIY